MTSRRFTIVIAILILIVCAVFWKSNDELSQRAYVWQRLQNSEEVVAAIETVPDFVDGLLPLVAEVHFRNGPENPPEIVRSKLTLAALQKRDAAVIRIGTSASQTRWALPACQFISDLAREFLLSPEWVPGELQIDYDCPQRKLEDYANLIRHLRASFPKTKLTFTALPSWLGEVDFAPLANLADSYVLQVHSLQLPDTAGEPIRLIHFEHARDAILIAGQLGHKFEVALPTYACFVIFEADGDRVFDVVSEDLPDQWPRNTGPIRYSETDPNLSSLLVADLKKSHPAALTGIVWYRLPVETDAMNWNRATWEKVARGERPETEIQIESKPANGITGRTELILQNTGETVVALPEKIALEVVGDGRYRFDGGQLYLGKGDPLAFHLIRRKIDHLPLPPGESVLIGWIEGNVSVTASIP